MTDPITTPRRLITVLAMILVLFSALTAATISVIDADTAAKLHLQHEIESRIAFTRGAMYAAMLADCLNGGGFAVAGRIAVCETIDVVGAGR